MEEVTPAQGYTPMPSREATTRSTQQVFSANLSWQPPSKANKMIPIEPIGNTTPPPKASHVDNLPFISLGSLNLHKIDPHQLQSEKELGEGNFGKVYLATWEGAFVAVKELKHPEGKPLTTEEREQCEREMRCMAHLNHPRVTLLYGISIDATSIRMVMEYCPGGTLRGLLNNRQITWSEKIQYARDIALGLGYLHSYDITHGDLAAENVLMDGEGRPKLADFGLSVKRHRGQADFKGHTGKVRSKWMAPEVLAKDITALNPLADRFSYGVVLWEIATQEEPVSRNSLSDPYLIPHDAPESYAQVIRDCWKTNPNERPSSQQAFDRLGVHIANTSSQESRPLEQLQTQLREYNRATASHWKQRFGATLPYVSRRATEEVGGSDGFLIGEAIDSFLTGPAKVLLILGDSGSGKTTLLAHLTLTKGDTFIPLLVSLPTLPGPEQNLMQRLLTREGLNEAEIERLRQDQVPLLLLLDGYDEASTQENLFNTNQLWSWNVKVIITCRTEAIARQDNYKRLFHPSTTDGSQESQGLRQCILQPFDESQTEEYIKQYVSLHATILPQDWRSSSYFLERLQEIPDLGDLVQNPFCLYLVATILPKISANQNPTRSTLYGAFLLDWFAQQQQRLINQGKLSSNTDLISDFYTYAKSLAVTLYEHQIRSVTYHPGETLFGENANEATFVSEWGRFFDDRYHPKIPLLRTAGPMQVTGNQWMFLHKSIWEYLIAQQILTELDKEPEESLLNLRLLSNELGIIGFLADAAQDIKHVRDRLFTIVKDSSQKPQLAIASANCMTIRNAAKVPFSGEDLRGIRAPGAILDGAVLHGTDLRGADLSGTSLRNAYLANANLSGANLSDVQFGQQPYLQHPSPVWCVRYSLDGRLIATAGSHVFLWNAQTGDLIFKLRKHTDIVLGVAFDQSGNRLASVSRDKTVRLWDTQTGQELLVLSGHQRRVTSVAFHPAGARLASASDDETVRIWDAKTGQELLQLCGHDKGVISVDFDSTGTRLASAGEDKTIQIWDAISGMKLGALKGHTGRVTCVAFDPTGTRLASASDDRTVRIWNTETSDELVVLKDHMNSVQGLIFDATGARLATASRDCSTRVWDVHTGKEALSLRGHQKEVTGVAFDPTGIRLASASQDNTVRIWQIESHQQISPFGKPDNEVSSRRIRKVLSLGDTQCDLALSYFSLIDNSKINVLDPTGKRYATAEDCSIQIRDTKSGQLLKVLKEHRGPVTHISFDPTGTRMASAGEDKTVRIWNLSTYEEMVCMNNRSPNGQLVFDPTGTILAFPGTPIQIFYLKTLRSRIIRNAHGTRYSIDWSTSVAVSSTGARLVSGSQEGEVQTCDLNLKKPLFEAHGHYGRITSIAFDPTDKLFATASEDKTIRIWRTSSVKTSKILKGHTDEVLHVVFDPTGRQLVSISTDNTVRIWDVFSGKQLQVLDGQTQIRFNSDGSWLVSSGHDEVQLWQRTLRDKYRLMQVIGTPSLNARGAGLATVVGLTPSNLELLLQHGGVNDDTASTPDTQSFSISATPLPQNSETRVLPTSPTQPLPSLAAPGSPPSTRASSTVAAQPQSPLPQTSSNPSPQHPPRSATHGSTRSSTRDLSSSVTRQSLTPLTGSTFSRVRGWTKSFLPSSWRMTSTAPPKVSTASSGSSSTHQAGEATLHPSQVKQGSSSVNETPLSSQKKTAEQSPF